MLNNQMVVVHSCSISSLQKCILILTDIIILVIICYYSYCYYYCYLPYGCRMEKDHLATCDAQPDALSALESSVQARGFDPEPLVCNAISQTISPSVFYDMYPIIHIHITHIHTMHIHIIHIHIIHTYYNVYIYICTDIIIHIHTHTHIHIHIHVDIHSIHIHIIYAHIRILLYNYVYVYIYYTFG